MAPPCGLTTDYRSRGRASVAGGKPGDRPACPGGQKRALGHSGQSPGATHPLRLPAGFAIIRQRLLWLVCFLTDRRSGVRDSLVAALVACADQPLKSEARRFLAGLSSDELQFIAEFLGSCVLESQVRCARNRAELAERIARFQQARAGRARMRSPDQELKMILLLEYLCRSGVQEFRMSAAAGSGSVN